MGVGSCLVAYLHAKSISRLSTVGFCLSHRVASSMLHLEGSELHPQINEASDVFFFLFKALFVFQYSSDDARSLDHLIYCFYFLTSTPFCTKISIMR